MIRYNIRCKCGFKWQPKQTEPYYICPRCGRKVEVFNEKQAFNMDL